MPAHEDPGLEAAVRPIANYIVAAVEAAGLAHGRKLRVALIITDEGDAGFFTWICNAERSGMIALLREAAQKLEADHG